MTLPLYVDRAQFVCWTQGILLDRTQSSLVLVDERACAQAESDLEEGLEIITTVDGRPYSRMRLDSEADAYVETVLDSGGEKGGE